MNPDPKHVKQAFWNRYYDEHQTYDGVQQAFEWWSDPDLKCAKQEAGRGSNKCNSLCEFCRNKRIREVSSESQAA